MKKLVIFIFICGIVLSGCTVGNDFFYAYDKGDCKSEKFDDIDDTYDLRFEWKNDSLYVRWNEYEGDDFYGYYLIRSEGDSCPYYYYGGSYHKYVGKRITTLFIDDVVDNTTYYYRLCLREKDKSVDCGSVWKVQIY